MQDKTVLMFCPGMGRGRKNKEQFQSGHLPQTFLYVDFQIVLKKIAKDGTKPSSVSAFIDPPFALYFTSVDGYQEQGVQI